MALKGADPATALVHNLAVAGAGAAALTATNIENDYLMGIEEYRGYNLDWLIPLGLAALAGLMKSKSPKSKTCPEQSRRCQPCTINLWSWLPLVGLGLAGLAQLAGGVTRDLPASLDREHRHAHTHHLSAFQRHAGDIRLAISARPLRKWSFLAPFGAVLASLFGSNSSEPMATFATSATAAGHIASLAGFRNGQRPILRTTTGRAKGWAFGFLLAAIVWLALWLRKK
jgi:hypothetical protein